MTPTILFIIIIGIILFDFVFELFQEYLNSTRWSNILPEALKGIYDDEKYKQSMNYEKTTTRFSLLQSSIMLVLTLVFLFNSGFAILHNLATSFSSNSILMSLYFFLFLFIITSILSIPFSYYSTFVIEEKFGFNKSTHKLFWLDSLKSFLLSILIGGIILGLIIVLYEKTGQWFWLLAWLTVMFFSLFMLFFYSDLIVPLFNKQTPLPEGDLRNSITKFAEKAGFSLKDIYSIDGSKRSSKANAYFTGFGKKKRIVLYDTLVNDLTTEETVAVLAHEIGHYKHKHIVTSILLSFLQTGFLFWLLSLFISKPEFSQAFGVENATFHIGIIAFGMLYSPISMITGILMNILSRHNEYQADAFAASYGLGNALGSSLKKLSIKNLSNLTPHPFNVFVEYSHPTLLQRLSKLNK